MRYSILVPLRGDPTALREVEAVAAGEGRFRLTGSVAGEAVEFEAGELVDCEIRALPGGSKALVAIRSVSADPEYRKRRNTFGVLGGLAGGILGALFSLSLNTSPMFLVAGTASGSVIFAFCSVRWGDAAWNFLIRLFQE